MTRRSTVIVFKLSPPRLGGSEARGIIIVTYGPVEARGLYDRQNLSDSNLRSWFAVSDCDACCELIDVEFV